MPIKGRGIDDGKKKEGGERRKRKKGEEKTGERITGERKWEQINLTKNKHKPKEKKRGGGEGRRRVVEIPESQPKASNISRQHAHLQNQPVIGLNQ